MVPADHDGRADVPGGHELVEGEPRLVALAVPEPADAGGQPLEGDTFLGHPDPPLQPVVVREQAGHRAVGRQDVGRVARQRHPPERPLSLAEERPDERGHEPRIGVGPLVCEPALLGPRTEVVAVVEHYGAPFQEPDHRLDVLGHRGERPALVLVRVPRPEVGSLLRGQSGRNVPAQGVVGARLVGHDVRLEPAPEQIGEHLRRIALEADRHRITRGPGLVRPADGLIQVAGLPVEVPGLDAALDARGVDLDAERDALIHRHGQWLGATHAPQTGGERHRPLEGAAELLLTALGQGLVGPLQDALRSDVDPRSRGHLAVHREALGLQAPERVPIGPLRDQHRVRDQHPGSRGLRAEHADRLPRLDEEGLVVVQ